MNWMDLITHSALLLLGAALSLYVESATRRRIEAETDRETTRLVLGHVYADIETRIEIVNEVLQNTRFSQTQVKAYRQGNVQAS